MKSLSKMSWCQRCVMLPWLRTHEARTISSHSKQKIADDEVERQAKEYLENISDDKKKQLKVLEMEYEILRANKEPVPTILTCRQKKKMLLLMRKNADRLDYLINLRRREDLRQNYEAKRNQRTSEQYYQVERQGTFVFAEQHRLHLSYSIHRMLRASVTGMPLVYDVGYNMRSKENWKLINFILNAWTFVKEHKEPARFIVAGLDKNPTLKEEIQLRPQIWKSLIEFRDEPYWDLFPRSKMVYVDSYGPELTEVDGNNVYVLCGGNRMPNIREDAEVRSMPYQRRLFENTASPVPYLKAKILMDLSLEKDVDKVYEKNFREGLFKKHNSVERHKGSFLAKGVIKKMMFTQSYSLQKE